MKQFLTTIFIVVLTTKIDSISSDFRPPAVPLIVFSPHVSVWSFSDNLTDSNTVHWTGKTLGFHGLIEIDHLETYRFLGADPSTISPLKQTKLVVQPWRTIYTFSTPTDTIELVVQFSQPTSIDDPFTYITFDVRTLDKQTHSIRIYFEQSSSLVINSNDDKVYWTRTDNSEIIDLSISAYNQVPFGVHGDSERNNWGYAHLISSVSSQTKGYQGSADKLRQAFIQQQPMPDDDTDKPRYPNVDPVSSAFVIDLGEISSDIVSSYLIFLYDDVYSMYYFQEKQPPIWRAKFNNNLTLLITKAISSYLVNMIDITESNQMLITLLTNAGGSKYAQLCSLALRQITGALSRTWSYEQDRSFLFMKEISSGGAVSTVDVIYPSSPYFLWIYPEMLRDLLLPILAYANNETTVHYNLTWAPHHLGNWPICDLLPNEQEQMPVEESANMLLMLAGIVQRTKQIDFLQPYWNLLETWGQYLNDSLPDPGNQLCTDDFEGASPHNCNLALKGILGLGAYALLLDMNGHVERAKVYMEQAKIYVDYWTKTAYEDEHFRLQYDLPNTWSQKYNLVFQPILSLDIFSSDVINMESAYYQTKLLDYGLALDSRSTLTKTDWSSWAAAISSTKQQEDNIWDRIYRFAHESPDRVPFSDGYNVSNGRVLMFQARPVMGGLFVRALLENPIIKSCE